MSDHGHRLRRTLWATAAFLMAFAVLVAVVTRYYLVPALDAARNADSTGKRQLSAFSTLLLAIVLFTLLVGLLMTFRIRRFFFPPPTESRTQTQHIDVWAESAKRVKVPKPEDDSDDERESWDDMSET